MKKLKTEQQLQQEQLDTETPVRGAVISSKDSYEIYVLSEQVIVKQTLRINRLQSDNKYFRMMSLTKSSNICQRRNQGTNFVTMPLFSIVAIKCMRCEQNQIEMSVTNRDTKFKQHLIFMIINITVYTNYLKLNCI